MPDVNHIDLNRLVWGTENEASEEDVEQSDNIPMLTCIKSGPAVGSGKGDTSLVLKSI